jgi:hypothetical protein
LLAQNEGYRGTNIDNDFGRLIPNNASTLETPDDEDNFVGDVTGGLFIVRMHALRIRVQPSQCGR